MDICVFIFFLHKFLIPVVYPKVLFLFGYFSIDVVFDKAGMKTMSFFGTWFFYSFFTEADICPAKL